MPMITHRFWTGEGTHPDIGLVTVGPEERIRRICAKYKLKPFQLKGGRYRTRDRDQALYEIIRHFKHWGWTDSRIALWVGISLVRIRMMKRQAFVLYPELPYIVPPSDQSDPFEQTREPIAVQSKTEYQKLVSRNS